MRDPSLKENSILAHLLSITNKTHAVIFIFILCSGIRVISQPDTLLLKRQIESLTDHASIQTYLDTIFKRDQQFRGNHAITLNDLENLISISYYFNAFGYPSEEDFGEASMAPRYIWNHNAKLTIDD